MVLQDLLNSFKKLEGKENFPIYINNELLIGIDTCSTGEEGLETGGPPGGTWSPRRGYRTGRRGPASL